MARERLCRVCRSWHSLDDAWPHNCRTHDAPRQTLAAPMVNCDSMGAVKSMTNGQMYDSKSALRREYRRAGVQEVGNDVPTAKPVADKAARKRDRQAVIERSLSRAGFGA